jgi:HEAT repeat protein
MGRRREEDADRGSGSEGGFEDFEGAESGEFTGHEPAFAPPGDARDLEEREIRSLDDVDEAEYEDLVSRVRGELSVAELLNRLVSDPQEVHLRDLFALSDLSRSDLALVEERWPQIPVERRRKLVAGLVESAEYYLQLQLGRLLRVALRDADAEVRRLAVSGLWEDEESDLIGAFVQLLNNDPEAAVRAAAAAGLGSFVLAGELEELDAPLAMRAEEALLAVLHSQEEPLEVQCRALESLAFSSETGLRQLIEDAYYSPDEEMRLSAVRAMGRSADTRWRSFARVELDSPSVSMRAEAAIACGELDAQAAKKKLLALLSDEEQEVRLAAIYALGHIGGRDARNALSAIAEGEDEDEAEAAEQALDEMLFYDEAGAVPLFEEGEEEGPDADDEPWWESGRDDEEEE